MRPEKNGPSFVGRRLAGWSLGDVALEASEWWSRRAAIHAGSRRATRFAEFGDGSIICFPPAALYGERAIRIGEGCLIGPRVSLSAGMHPEQSLISDEILVIGDRCLIGRNTSLVAHLSIVIEPDVYFGPNVYVTDQNHSSADPDLPIGHQLVPEGAVRIGAESWLGTNVVVTPGVTIGRRVTVGANSVVTTDLPDGCVAAGAPARVIG